LHPLMLFVPIQSIGISEKEEAWVRLFEKTWPAYRKWFLKEGLKSRPGYLSSLSAFEVTFPELRDIYLRLCKLAGNEDITARFLSMYCPPPYMSGCSQLAWTRDHPLLVRNYDYSPRYFEGAFVKTHWLKPVMGMSDCTWGLLDGINADGLCASLTFGGRRISGKGFGITLVLRYCLETCSTTAEAVEKLLPIPVHMAYNVTLVDANLHYATIYFIPGQTNQVTYQPVGTNHQEEVSWPDYAIMTRTVERRSILEQALLNPDETSETLINKFLQPPLFNTAYEKAFGTLYTAVYSSPDRSVSLLWPERKMQLNLDGFESKKTRIALKTNASRLLSL